MPIYFSAIAMETFILAKCASHFGNFTEVTNEVLSKIPREDKKLTYSNDGYLYHYIAENKMVYFCITDNQFQCSRAFSFLNKVKFRFLDSLGRMPLAMLPSALLTRFNDGEFFRILASEMPIYTTDYKTPLANVEAGLNDCINIVEQNIKKIEVRGELLDTLLTRAAELESTALMFKQCAEKRNLRYWWKNNRVYVFMVLFLVSVACSVGAIACGGLM